MSSAWRRWRGGPALTPWSVPPAPAPGSTAAASRWVASPPSITQICGGGGGTWDHPADATPAPEPGAELGPAPFPLPAVPGRADLPGGDVSPGHQNPRQVSIPLPASVWLHNEPQASPLLPPQGPPHPPGTELSPAPAGTLPGRRTGLSRSITSGIDPATPASACARWDGSSQRTWGEWWRPRPRSEEITLLSPPSGWDGGSPGC